MRPTEEGGGRPRLQLPSSRGGAALIAAGLAVIGFSLGIALLFLLPMARAGQGPFGFLGRFNRPPPSKFGQLAPAATPIGEGRPELWRTPTANVSFPSAERLSELSGSGTVGV